MVSFFWKVSLGHHQYTNMWIIIKKMLFIFDFISAVEKFSMVPLGRLKLCSTSQYGLLDHIISLYVPQVEITRKMSANSFILHLPWIRLVQILK